MEYVHVASNLSHDSGTKQNILDFELAAIKHCKNVLISLIHAFRNKGNIIKSIDNISDKINTIFKHYQCQPSQIERLFIDSGGYSFITGGVPFESTEDVIFGYNKYLKDQHDNFDAIFSLDIPFWGEECEKFTKENIFKYNCKSLKDSLSIIVMNEELRKKFYFVWQFKIKEQFDVWNELYQQLDLIENIQNRAIGGLVSLKSKTNINFSPFTEVAMRCFLDHLYSPFEEERFSLHVLGQNRPYHRFQIQLLDLLFYAHHGIKPLITYDSANYSIEGLYDVRNIEIAYIDEMGELKKESKLKNIPEEIIKTIFHEDQKLLDAFYQYVTEKERPKKKKLSNPEIGIPLNVFSQLQIDKYFEVIIDESEIIEKIKTVSHSLFSSEIMYFVEKCKEKLKPIFNMNDFKTIENDLSQTYLAYQVIKDENINYEEKKRQIDEMICETIKNIRYDIRDSLR